MDPPYQNTVKSHLWEKFDSDKFWDLVRILSKIKNVIVFVSEISAPNDFKCIYKFKRTNGMHNISKNTTIEEKVFILE
jgi:hypothetical protein